MDRIGFIGIGDLGLPMAIKVLEAGFDLTVFDIRPEAVRQIVGLGARSERSVGELAAASDIIEVMVVSAEQVEDVCLAPEGVIASASPGSIVVIHSTVGAAVCMKVADAGARRDIHVIDAGVSGGGRKAELGELSLLVGGAGAHVDQCKPLFSSFASEIHHVGEQVGSGQVAKILNNHAYFCNLFVLQEVLALSRAAGIADEMMIDILNSSTGRSVASETWQYMGGHQQTYRVGQGRLAQVIDKDLSLSMELARDLGIDVPVAALVANLNLSTGPVCS